MAQGNKTVSEWAYRIARNQGRDVQTMAENLEAAARLARRMALMEAAKVAEASLIASGCGIVATIIATEIRALIDKPQAASRKPQAAVERGSEMMAYQIILTRCGKDQVLYTGLTQEELGYATIAPLCPDDVIRVEPMEENAQCPPPNR